MELGHPKVVVAASESKEGIVISRTLRGGGYRVSRAKNCRECLRHLKRHPDIVLLDLSFEGSEEVIRRVKNGNGKTATDGLSLLAFDHRRNSLKEIKAFRLGAE